MSRINRNKGVKSCSSSRTAGQRETTEDGAANNSLGKFAGGGSDVVVGLLFARRKKMFSRNTWTG